MGIVTVLWEKWIEFKRDFVKITLAAMIAPLLYVVVFGRGIGELSGGQPYLNFLVPGVVALTTMNGSFSAIAQNLNVQRLYDLIFLKKRDGPAHFRRRRQAVEHPEVSRLSVDCPQRGDNMAAGRYRRHLLIIDEF